MIEESLINSPLLAALAITLIHFLWQGVLIAVVLKIILSLISYQKSQLRYAFSSMAMLASLVLPTITFFIVYDTDFRQVTNFVHALPLTEQNIYLEQIHASAWYMEWLAYFPLVTMVWLVIIAALALKLIVELYNVNKLPLQGCTPADISLQKRFDTLIAKVGLARNVALLLSNKTDVPMAIGWLKPVVLIPFSMLSGLTPQQLDMLLLHELAHIRRHDYLVNFLQTLVEILLFFHPAVSWISKQMRNEREYCSDDIAVQHSGSSLAYAHTLADTASLCAKHRHHAIPNMAMAASGGDLKQRIVRLVDQQHCTKSIDSGKWLASFTILLSIIFLFSKYSLTLPIIDVQSGSISLHHSATALNKRPTSHLPSTLEQGNANTTLASRLLAIDNSNVNESSLLKKSVNSSQTINKEYITSEKTLLNEQSTVNENSAPIYYNALPFVRVNSNINNNYAEQHLSEFKNLTKINQHPNRTKAKSISTLAFERTDSNNASTTEKINSYSQQISTLLNEPLIANNAPMAVLNNQQYVISKQEQTDNIEKFRDTRFNQDKLSTSDIEHKAFQTDVVAARLLNSAEPKYPSSAKRKGIELEIMVEFSIDRNGLVKDLQFESKSKVSYFRNSIRHAMEKWRFLPATENGRTVESKMSKIFSFILIQ